MFLPQTIMAISAALLGGRLEHRWGEKRVFLAGLVANLASMSLLVGSRFALGAHLVAFTLLLVATALMGIGFGLDGPRVEHAGERALPRRVNVAVLALNALLGLGTALAPLLVALFVHLGAWWVCRWPSGRCWPRFFAWSVPLPLDAAGAPEATSPGRDVSGSSSPSRSGTASSRR